MRAIPIVLAASLLASAPAFATCTMEEANEMAAKLGQKVNEITQSDPERAQALNQELREMRLKRTGDTLQDECKAYETRMQELEQAEDQAGLEEED